MGDYLIAGVHGDVDIAKNKANPVLNDTERARIISAVKWVDEVQTDIPYGNVLKILDKNDCDFCVHGDDIATDASGCDIYAESKKKGRFKECKRTDGISTTLIIDRILFGVGLSIEVDTDLQPAKNGKERALEMPEEYYQKKVNQFSSRNTTPVAHGKVVYTQGVFDLFHAGHVDFLEKCKTSVKDCVFIVGILDDNEAQRVFGSYPVTNTYERALVLLSCKFVDRVEIGVPFEVTAAFLENLKVMPV